jgi:GntR family transcriptional repressor for pyruvate dehydrogenase complex
VASSSLNPYSSVARAPSLSDKVAEQLTEAITSRRLPPGELLPSERDLGDKFKVSRTVVREAVRSLAARGLVRVTAGRGVEVIEGNSDHVAASMRLMVRGHEGLDYGKVHEVRMAVEVQTAGPKELERLREICDEHQRCLDKKDSVKAGELDFEFHRELTRASGNELLVAMLDSISDVLREVRNQSMNLPHVGEDGLKAHRKILKYVSSGKPEVARDAMIEHLAEAERVWRDLAAQTAQASARKAKAKAKKRT